MVDEILRITGIVCLGIWMVWHAIRMFRIEKWMRETEEWAETVNNIMAKQQGKDVVGFYDEEK